MQSKVGALKKEGEKTHNINFTSKMLYNDGNVNVRAYHQGGHSATGLSTCNQMQQLKGSQINSIPKSWILLF